MPIKITLSEAKPELIKEWHPTKNGDLTPFNVSYGSSKKCWWRCKEGHEWKAAVKNRTRGTKCPKCGRVYRKGILAVVNPELAKEWHPTKNEDLTPFDVTHASRKEAWWQCKEAHEWKAFIFARSRGDGCPYCTGQKVCEDNSFAVMQPPLAKEWHPTKNGDLTPFDVTAFSHKKVWWLCQENKEHEWKASVANRSQGRGCPYCSEFKTEKKCRDLFESILDKPFYKTRKVLDGRLELDGYCEELRLAFEYNGRQHYDRKHFWYKTGDRFKEQQERDKLKISLCREKGIFLIVIPYTEENRLEEFIREKLSSFKE